MSVFLLIVCSILLGDITWWIWADRKLRPLRRARVWRVLIGIFSGSMLAYIGWSLLFPDTSRQAHVWLPVWLLAAVYVWHLLILPLALVGIIVIELSRGAASAIAMFKRRTTTPHGPPDAAQVAPTRRQLLAAAAVAVPPLMTAAAVMRAMGQVHHFRIRRLEIPLAQLPPQLDGLTIAHVSDLHVGRFTRARMLPVVADATNALKADLVLLTGDLIDLSLVDLPAGLDFIRRLDPRHGLFMCEGNHDLIDDPIAFEARVKAAGVPLLLDESAVVRVRDTPIQIFGMSWSRRETAIASSIQRLIAQRHDGLFHVLLAHHPHAFDPAADAGIPLTLSGHTHGGQLMLNEALGAGPMMYRYFSGLYRRSESALVVSNGVGNWFPLRIHAPAEIVHITLRSASRA